MFHRTFLQTLSKNNCIGVFPFSKVAGERPVTLLKGDSGAGVFLWILKKKLALLFCRTSANVEVTYVKIFIIWHFC